MGNEDEAKSCKSEKPSSPVTLDQAHHAGQTNVHVYPDWAAMQAYYGPRVPLPPYYSSPLTSGLAPHPYMWGPPQSMMPPYGVPCASIYSHGSVYAHPGFPLGSHGQGLPSSPAAVSHMNVVTPTKLCGNTERGLMKKLKEFDGLAMSLGSGNIENAEQAEQRSQSTETEGSSDGSDENTAQEKGTRIKRSREGTPVPTVADEKTKELNPISKKLVGSTVSSAGIPGILVGCTVSSSVTTALESKNPTDLISKTSPSSLPHACPVVPLPPEAWLQNDRELKRERRKQSNRESARRSRLRKQAEAEELARKVESFTAENMILKSELSRLTENSEKLRVENAKLMEKVRNAQLGHREDIIMSNIDDKRIRPISTENLLSRVNNNGSVDRNAEEEKDMFDKKSSGTKLRQLLDTSRRADAVAAG